MPPPHVKVAEQTPIRVPPPPGVSVSGHAGFEYRILKRPTARNFRFRTQNVVGPEGFEPSTSRFLRTAYELRLFESVALA